MIAALIRWSVVNRFLVLIATAFLIAAGVWSVTKTPLDALPDLSDTQVIVRTPFPGKAPQIVEDLVTYPMTTTMLERPRRQDGARLFVLRRLLRLRALRRQDRSVLGALARRRIPQPGAESPAIRCERLARSRRHRRRLGLRVRAGRSQRHAGPQSASVTQRLGPEVRAEDGAGRRRGGQHRRHGASVPGRSRSGPDAHARHHAGDRHRRAAEGEPGDRRLGRRAGRGRVHGPLARLPAVTGRLPQHPAVGDQRDARPPPGCGNGAARPGTAPRHRRAGRTRRSRRRRGRHALRQERAHHDRGGQGQARELEIELAARRRDRVDLRPLAADRPCRRSPAIEAGGGVHRCRAGVRDFPVSPSFGAGRRRGIADRRAGGVRRHALARRQRQHHVAGRDRDRDRRHGGCIGRHGRERAQAHRSLRGTAPTAAKRRRALDAGERVRD